MPDAGRPASAAAMRSLHQTMVKLGFSVPQIAVYLRLLVHGRRTSQQLREGGAIDDAQLFDSTRQLKRLGLVTEYRHGQRTAWYCIDPATAWLGLAADVTWSAVPTIVPLDRLPKTGVAEVDEQSALYRAAVRPAIRLWAGGSPPTRESRAAHSAQALAQLAVEAVRVARAHVRSISVSPKVSSAAQFWPALKAQMAAGVAYTRLADLMEVYEHGLDIVERDMAEGVSLRIGLYDDLRAARGYVADRRVLVRYDPVPVGEPPVTGYMTSDRHAIDRFVRRFEKLRAVAVPADVAIQHLAGLVPAMKAAASALSSDANDRLAELIRVGRFSNLPTVRGWTDEHASEIEAELRGAGVVVRTAAGLLLPAWPNPTETTKRLMNNA